MTKLKFIEKFPVEANKEKYKIEEIISRIASVHTCVEKAKLIETAFEKFVIIGNKAIAVRTHCWACLGRMLNDLQIQYKFDETIDHQKTSWSKFCNENFKNFYKTRRDNAKRLADTGGKLEKYYFLGIDNVLKLITVYKKLKNSKINLSEALSIYGVNLNDDLSTEVSQKEFGTKLNRFLEYYSNIKEFSKLNMDTELYRRCTTVGCCYTKEVGEYIETLSSDDEKILFLKKSIAGRRFNIPKNSQNIKRSRSSISLFCKLLDNYNIYVENIDNIPKALNRGYIKDLCKLEVKIRKAIAKANKNEN